MKRDNEIYSQDELKLFKAIESGDYTPLPDDVLEKEKQRFKAMAINTMRRKTIPIEIIEQDLPKIEAMALSEGMPYQIFIASVLHKLATGKIKTI